EALHRDRDQLWAEAVRRYREGARCWIDDPALLAEVEEEQSARFQPDPWQDLIAQYLSNPKRQTVYVTMNELLRVVLPPPETEHSLPSYRDWNQAAATRIGRIKKVLQWEGYKKRIGHAPATCTPIYERRYKPEGYE